MSNAAAPLAGPAAPVLPAILPTTARRVQSISKIDRASGYRYALEVVQQPRRARMCGFGDKDRRPITPPPCVRLVVTDGSGQDVDPAKLDQSMFVLTVDLWSPDGEREANLVRPAPAPLTFTHPAMPYPAMPYPAIPPPAIPHPANPHSAMPYPPMPPPAPPSYPPLPPLGRDGPAYPPHTPPVRYTPATQFFPSAIHTAYSPHPAAAMPHLPPVISPYGAPAYAVDPSQHNAPDRLAASSSPQGMFTRNLIGSLASSAFKLTDHHNKAGIWFVLQDLSVRTEGNFRLRFSFLNVGAPAPGPHASSSASQGLNTGRAPVLAAAFSDVFYVFSAKRFPGVCESTPLSKAFAAQGIKIPIRKESAEGRADDMDDDD